MIIPLRSLVLNSSRALLPVVCLFYSCCCFVGVGSTMCRELRYSFRRRGPGRYRGFFNALFLREKAASLSRSTTKIPALCLNDPPRPGAIFFVVARPRIHDGRPVLIPDRSIF